MRRDERWTQILNRLGQIQEALDRSDWAAAHDALVEVRGRDPRAASSGFVLWWLAICLDHLERHEEALATIEECIRVDPINIPANRSYDVIVSRIQAAVDARPTTEPSVERLYDLLLRMGEATETNHLAVARHLASTGRADRALQILEAVTTLYPANRDAWELLATIAGDVGRADLAELSRNTARALGDQPAVAVTSTTRGST